jgi:ribosomal peptide maturation radical SAM protein 1
MLNIARSTRFNVLPRIREIRVIFVCMPWATTTRPSLALGILSRLCQEEDVPVKVFYGNMDLSAMIGFEAAGRFANERALYGLSEHLFACDLFGAENLNSDEYIETLLTLDLPNPFKEAGYIKRLRDEVVPAFLSKMEQRVLREDPTVVGFSSTFNQVMASLALGRRLKKRQPEIQVIAGGACFDGEMGQEYHRALPDTLDHVFMGEAEDSFRRYLRLLMADEPTQGIPGVTDVVDGKLCLIPGNPLQDMNQSPMPDYDDFFSEKERLQNETGKVFNIEFLPFESSRGCWWGQKNHCVFCGINDDLMAFREKDIDRVVSEMISLSARYRVVHLTAADWIISRKSRGEIFRRLRDLDLDIECFYETRADLSKEEIAMMQDAGIVKIQPGIESLSSELLRLMKKGTSRIKHVQFLRWCKEYDIHLSYNILAGFPGEKAEWYLDMADFIPKIIHVQPPLHNMHYVEMHRFSPLFQSRDQFQVDEYRIREDYGFNFPDGMVDPLKVGYFFSYHSSALAQVDQYAERVREVVGAWIDAHGKQKPPVYHYILGPGFTRITDTRQGDGRYLHLADLHQDILLLCDKVQTIAKLKEMLEPLYSQEIARGAVEETVQEMLAEDLLVQEGNCLLTLPIGYRRRTTEELYAYVLGEYAKPTQRALSA